MYLLPAVLFFLMIGQASADKSAETEPKLKPEKTTSENPKSVVKESEAKKTKEKDPNKLEFDHSHKQFTEVLKNFVIVSGPTSSVKYKALNDSPSQLNSYLKSLSSVTPKQYGKFSKTEKLAFFINAYNAFTLKLIIDHYPVDSIKDIGGLFSSPWKIEFFKLLGRDMYLDKIEHKILRKKFNEPRIHFAVNCASIGCPALRAEAYTAEKLNDQLEEQTRAFLQDSDRNKYKLKDKELILSKIFKWFTEDFEKGGSTVSKFVAPYMSDDENLKKQISTFEVDDYTDYNWDLNSVN